MIAVAGDALAWAKECLAAGDAPEEVAPALDLSEEQLLCAADIRKAMSPRQREAAQHYAAGSTLVVIAGAMGLRSTTGVAGLLETARVNGYAIPRRVERRVATRREWVDGGRAKLGGSALGAGADAARAAS